MKKRRNKNEIIDSLLTESSEDSNKPHVLNIKISSDIYDLIKKYKILNTKVLHGKLPSTSDAVADLIELAITDDLPDKIREKYPQANKKEEE